MTRERPSESDRVFIRDLVLEARIGVNDDEQNRRQPVRINITLWVKRPEEAAQELSQVVCYAQLTDDIRSLVESGHVGLVETMAEKIAALCLTDPRVEAARVRVEKLKAVAQAAGAGVEIVRRR